MVPLTVWTQTPKVSPCAPPTAPWHPPEPQVGVSGADPGRSSYPAWGKCPHPCSRGIPQSLQPSNPSSALLFCQSGQQGLCVLVQHLKRLRLLGEELCSLWVRFDCSGRGEVRSQSCSWSDSAETPWLCSGHEPLHPPEQPHVSPAGFKAWTCPGLPAAIALRGSD